MQDRWETEILNREVPRKGFSEQHHGRWDTSNDDQIPSSDTNRLMTTHSGKKR